MDEYQGAVDTAQALAVNLLAQITAENVSAPITGATLLGIGFFAFRWIAGVVVAKLDAMLSEIQNTKIAVLNELRGFSRAHERALFLNTQATMLQGIAQDESSTAMKDKLRSCLKDLEEAEAQRLRRNDDIK